MKNALSLLIPFIFAFGACADELPLEKRIGERTFPSVFQAWSAVQGLKEDTTTSVARHDLFFTYPEYFGLRWDKTPQGLAENFTPESVVKARDFRTDLLKRNPQMVLLAEIRHRDAHKSFLPENSAWWKRDAQGKIVPGWEEGGYWQMDYANPDFQNHVAAQAKAVIESGVCDGVMLDWWSEDAARVELVKRVRAAIGDKALIMVNSNHRQVPQSAPYVNGIFMECYISKTPDDWQRISETLLWAEANLRTPRVNCLETWYQTSRDDFHLMRATTTLALTHSDGYCLFSDPNELPTPDHAHNWYEFWEKSLGRPLASGSGNGVLWRREFQNGTAVYNAPGHKPSSITFAAPCRSLATGKIEKTHVVNGADGDIFQKLP